MISAVQYVNDWSLRWTVVSTSDGVIAIRDDVVHVSLELRVGQVAGVQRRIAASLPWRAFGFPISCHSTSSASAFISPTFRFAT